MPNKLIQVADGVAIRIDEVFTTNEKHLVTPFVRPDGKESYFGSFKFKDPAAARITFDQAIQLMAANFGVKEDNFFNGTYPKFKTDNYGSSLEVQNRVKFYKDTARSEEVNPLEIRDGIYSLEVHFKRSKDDGIFVVVPRATLLRVEQNFVDDLYDDKDENFPF